MGLSHIRSVDRGVVGVIEKVLVREIVRPFHRHWSAGSHLESRAWPRTVVSPEARRRKLWMHLLRELGHLNPVVRNPVGKVLRPRNLGDRQSAHIFCKLRRISFRAANPGRNCEPRARNHATLQHCASRKNRSQQRAECGHVRCLPCFTTSRTRRTSRWRPQYTPTTVAGNERLLRVDYGPSPSPRPGPHLWK